jgi:glyoxalase family protein
MTHPHGIHHVTAIAGPPQENLDFYAGVLGMRLVKRSVNQDDPGTYHLFYADAEGHPGCDLTFFPWTYSAPGRLGAGLAVEVGLAVPPGSLAWWYERLARYGAGSGEREERFGERVLLVRDPHGLALALVETSDPWESTPWEASPVPGERQVRGLHGMRVWERSLALTGGFLTDVLGFAPAGQEGGWHRFALAGGGSGKWLEVRELPEAHRGLWGVGSVHHIAWRVPDDAAQREVRERVAAAGRQPTPVIDRFWFRSVYFKEPGGVLFELATDGPGFAVDEDPASLGERLVLPPWLEGSRAAIEARLPALAAPSPRTALDKNRSG